MLGSAIALWVVPFFPILDGSGVRAIMWRDSPLQAVICVLLSTALTLADYFLAWRLRRVEPRA